MKKVAIVGVGALGSHVALLLRNEAELRLIDFDKVAAKNTLSQFHPRTSVGKNKAEAFKQTFQLLFNLRPEVRPHRLHTLNVVELLQDVDLVIDCVDNIEARRTIQAHVRARASTAGAELACVHGGLAADGTFGVVRWDENFAPDEETPGAATCEDGEFLPFIATVAGYLAQAAQRYLRTGKKLGYSVYPTGAQSI